VLTSPLRFTRVILVSQPARWSIFPRPPQYKCLRPKNSGSYCGRSLAPSYFHEIPIPGIAPIKWGCLEASGPAGDHGKAHLGAAKNGGRSLTKARRLDRARPVETSEDTSDLPESFSWLDIPNAVQ